MTPAHITRLMTFAQHGEPKSYAASDMMRADLEALVVALAAFKPLNGRFFLRDGEWVKAAPESPVGETLYRCADGALEDRHPSMLAGEWDWSKLDRPRPYSPDTESDDYPTAMENIEAAQRRDAFRSAPGQKAWGCLHEAYAIEDGKDPSKARCLNYCGHPACPTSVDTSGVGVPLHETFCTDESKPK